MIIISAPYGKILQRINYVMFDRYAPNRSTY